MKQNKHKLNKGLEKTDPNPFRPTLYKFVDEPSELNVDTTMNGENQGRDVSLVIADNLDRMQREYLSKGHDKLLN